MKKALVTGGAGFIGSNLVKLLLENNFEVVILDNLSTGYPQNVIRDSRVHFIEGDILYRSTLEKAVEGCEVIFHLAASVGNLRSLRNPQLDSEINVVGTINILECARRFGIPKVVFSSSAAIFGEVRSLPQDEEHPLYPDTPYGASKLGAERQCLCYTKLYGISTVALRYFNVYGPNQRYDAYGNVIPIFATRLREGAPLIIYGDGTQTRDFVFVEDIARANLLAATQADVSGTFNIGSGIRTTVTELTDLCRQAFGNPDHPVEFQPHRKGEVIHSVANISKARRLLGFEPRASLKDGLKKYFQWLTTL